MENEKRTCNQICRWNDSSDGCIKPNGRTCPMSNTEPDASGWGQVKVANEKRLIYAECAKSIMREVMEREFYMAEGCVDSCPTVDAVEVVHARWIANRICSNCRKELTEWAAQNGYFYCPNCGAKMDGEDSGVR